MQGHNGTLVAAAAGAGTADPAGRAEVEESVMDLTQDANSNMEVNRRVAQNATYRTNLNRWLPRRFLQSRIKRVQVGMGMSGKKQPKRDVREATSHRCREPVAAPGSAAPAAQNSAGTQSRDQRDGRGLSGQTQEKKDFRAGTSNRSRVPVAAPGSAALAAQNSAGTQSRNPSVGRGLSGKRFLTPWTQARSVEITGVIRKHNASVNSVRILDEIGRPGRGLTYDPTLTAGSASGMSIASASASNSNSNAHKVCRCVGSRLWLV